MIRRDREALLSLGSNVDPDRWVPHALDLLRHRLSVEAVSQAWRSPAVGGTGTYPDFVNLAVRVHTDCPPRALREVCRRVEAICGRRRTADRYAARTLDLDVVWVDGPALDLGGWRLPDPGLATEAFVLVPCAEIAPDVRHPEAGSTLAELRDALPGALRRTLTPLDGPGDPGLDPERR